MLMRKLLVVLGPGLLCVVTCALFRWLDGVMEAGSFFLFMLKGVSLGACVALLLPVAGIRVKTTGLTPLLFVAAALLFVTLLYQYLETVGVLNWPILRAIISINGQVVLVESVIMGYLTLTAFLCRKRAGKDA